MGGTTDKGCLREEVTGLLSDILDTARFHDPGLGPNLVTFTASQLQNLHTAEHGSDAYPLSGFHIVPDESLLPTLTKRVRTALAGHILPDERSWGQEWIPNRLVPLVGGITTFSISGFTEKLILTAVILGSERATQMLFEWVEGKPIRYWQHAILDGVSVEHPLELDGAIRVSPLPDSPDKVFHHIPSVLRNMGYHDWQYKGRAVLSIAYEGTFPQQLQSEDGRSAIRKCVGLKGEDDPLDDFSQTLALASNHYCSWMHSWYDCGDWNVFQTAASVATRRDVLVHGNVSLSHEHLVKARDLFAARRAKKSNSQRLDIAIDRWLKSKQSGSALADQFIDLRIALEALFLGKDDNDELSFRIATRGAWYLGASFEERRRCFKTFRRAYAFGSKAVHASRAESIEKGLKWLGPAQGLCRAGILKQLDEDMEPSPDGWDDLVLGKKPDAG